MVVHVMLFHRVLLHAHVLAVSPEPLAKLSTLVLITHVKMVQHVNQMALEVTHAFVHNSTQEQLVKSLQTHVQINLV